MQNTMVTSASVPRESQQTPDPQGDALRFFPYGLGAFQIAAFALGPGLSVSVVEPLKSGISPFPTNLWFS